MNVFFFFPFQDLMYVTSQPPACKNIPLQNFRAFQNLNPLHTIFISFLIYFLRELRFLNKNSWITWPLCIWRSNEKKNQSKDYISLNSTSNQIIVTFFFFFSLSWRFTKVTSRPQNSIPFLIFFLNPRRTRISL